MPESSLLPVDAPPRELDVWLTPESSQPGDLFHNAWGGHFEGLTLPAFEHAVARVPVPRLFLPILYNSCNVQPISMVLVLDASTSMLRPSGVGGTKLDAVIDAAGRLSASLLGSTVPHQVSVVGFNDRGWIAQPLTRDAGLVREALARLRTGVAEGTRLDLGLLIGGYTLRESPEAGRVMVFLTDGMPNRVPTPIPAGRQEDTVLSAAEALWGQGVTIHALGYGRPDAADLAERVDAALLAAIAGPNGDSRVTPDAAQLAALFDELSKNLACPR
jgi:hypothetical protein